MSININPTDDSSQIDDSIERAVNWALDAEEVLSPDEICQRQTWCCSRRHGDDEPCLIAPRRDMGRTDFGPTAATRRRWP